MPVGLEEIARDLAKVQTSLSPADLVTIANVANAIMEFLGMFGLLKGSNKGLASAYVETLADIPADLLPAVIDGIRREWKFHYAPMPADLRAIVGEDIAKRNLVMMRLATAAIRMGEDPERAVP